MREVKERLNQRLFEYFDELLPDHVKKKLTASEVREIVEIVSIYIDDLKDAISALREPTVLHRTESSFADRQNNDSDQEPGFLDELAKV